MLLPRASVLVTPGNVPSHYFTDKDVLTQTILDMPGTNPSAPSRVPQSLVNKAGYPRQVTGNNYPKLGEKLFFFFFFNFSFPTPNRHQVSVRPNVWQMELR